MRGVWAVVAATAAFGAAPGAFIAARAVAARAETARTAMAHNERATVVTSLSVVPGSGRAEVILGVDGPVEIKDFELESPRRLVVDLSGARLAVPAKKYDKVERGGITNIRYAQFKRNVVRVVLDLDGRRKYSVVRGDGDVRISIEGSDAFAAWTAGEAMVAPESSLVVADAGAPADSQPADGQPAYDQSAGGQAADGAAPADTLPAPVVDTLKPPTTVARAAAQERRRPRQVRREPAPPPRPPEPRITVTYQDAEIRDVLAAFAAFSGRTIVVGKDVQGTVTAEVRDQPWDVALRAILGAQGLAASEEASGIISVDSYKNIRSKQASEPLVTQIVSVNYASAQSLVPTVKTLLNSSCMTISPGADGSDGAREGPGMMTACQNQGSVSADSGTNALIVTAVSSRINDVMSYIRTLDVRTPQVAIKAKIIFVNRTDIEEFGITYDLGTRTQFFNRLVQRQDLTGLEPIDVNGDGVPDAYNPTFTPVEGDRIDLGGRVVSAIANAENRVLTPALNVVYSTMLGKYTLTAFLDALQETRLADLQAEPTIVTLDNRRAEILVGQEIPLRVLDASAAGGAGGGGQAGSNVPRATVTLKEAGISLAVTPHITNNRQILMAIHAENSDAQLAGSDVGYIFTKQRADNQLLVGDGETAVIGGLTVTQVTKQRVGIPILMDLPLVGPLFATNRSQEAKRDLLILVTPHIVDEGERADTPGNGR
jgi:type IV pilus assembly protein PilQ